MVTQGLVPFPVIPPPVRGLGIDDFIGQDLPVRNDIVDDAIVPRGGKLILGGDKGLGKTVIVTQMALEIASGDPMLNLFDVPNPEVVVVAQKEIPTGKYQERLLQARSKYNRLNQKNLIILSRDDIYSALMFDTPQGERLLEQYINYYRPKVFVIDPMYLFHNIDEDRTQQVKKVLEVLDRMILKYGVTFLVSMHFRKPAKDFRTGKIMHQDASDFRGSGTWFHWCDTAIWLNALASDKVLLEMFARHGREEPPTVVMSLNRRFNIFEAEIQNSPTSKGEFDCMAALGHYRNGECLYDTLVQDMLNKFKHGPRQAKTIISTMRSKNLLYFIGAGVDRQVRLLTPGARQWVR